MAEKRPKKKGTSGGTTGSRSPMDVGLLEQIVRLMAANDLNTVDVRDGARRIVLKRGPAVVAMPAAGDAAPMAGMAPQAAAAPPTTTPGWWR